MKAVRIHRYGGELRLEDVPRPAPGPGDLLVQVHAASVNPVDFKIRDGKIKPLVRFPMPLTLGQDLSGVVTEVGADVRRFKPGDEIFARLDKDRIGAFAEYALVREGAAAPKPARLTHVEAASIPLVGLTTWQAMVEIGRVQRGQRVLVHGGSGGVGSFAVQLARHLGAWVATTAGARNFELMRKLGADQVIDYRAQQFDEVLEDIDFALDTQGGETLARTFSVMKRGGCVVSIAAYPDVKFARAWGVSFWVLPALAWLSRTETRLARKTGVRYEYLFMRADGAQLARIAELLDAGIIEPLVDRVCPLNQVAAAVAYSESGRATGKVVMQVA